MPLDNRLIHIEAQSALVKGINYAVGIEMSVSQLCMFCPSVQYAFSCDTRHPYKRALIKAPFLACAKRG